MKTVGAFEAKTKLSQLLREVEEEHAEIIIQKHHRNIARLIPYHDDRNKEFSKSDIINELAQIRNKQISEYDVVQKMINEDRKW